MNIGVFRIHLDQMFSLLVLLYLHDFIVFRDQPHGKYLSLGVLLSPGCACDAIDDHQCVLDLSGSGFACLRSSVKLCTCMILLFPGINPIDNICI